MGEFFIVINLQNSQWNSKEELSFCLNIGVALTDNLADKEKKKASYFDCAAQVREGAYLSDERQQLLKDYGGWLGYKITDKTNVLEFTDYFKIDLEENILPKLDELKTLKDCIEFYDKFEFWGHNLRRQIEESGIVVD